MRYLDQISYIISVQTVHARMRSRSRDTLSASKLWKDYKTLPIKTISIQTYVCMQYSPLIGIRSPPRHVPRTTRTCRSLIYSSRPLRLQRRYGMGYALCPGRRTGTRNKRPQFGISDTPSPVSRLRGTTRPIWNEMLHNSTSSGSSKRPGISS